MERLTVETLDDVAQKEDRVAAGDEVSQRGRNEEGLIGRVLAVRARD